MARVLRLDVGDALTVFDGEGAEYFARVAAVARGEVRIVPGQRRANERESSLRLTLVQGVSRGERMDWVVQKAVELGVTRIVPVLTERSVVRLDAAQARSKQRHW
ncbi:Ribosomal RNA small subunit methyltransferase E, partial [mine drainage metagenome]